MRKTFLHKKNSQSIYKELKFHIEQIDNKKMSKDAAIEAMEAMNMSIIAINNELVFIIAMETMNLSIIAINNDLVFIIAIEKNELIFIIAIETMNLSLFLQ